MIGVIVATHGRLAQELIRTAEGVVGPLPQILPVQVQADSDLRAEIRRAVQQLDQGEGAVLLTDMLGGSTTNCCLSLLAEQDVQVVTGVNLPMLLKLAALRAQHLDAPALARELAAAGQKAIVAASELLREKKP